MGVQDLYIFFSYFNAWIHSACVRIWYLKMPDVLGKCRKFAVCLVQQDKLCNATVHQVGYMCVCVSPKASLTTYALFRGRIVSFVLFVHIYVYLSMYIQIQMDLQRSIKSHWLYFLNALVNVQFVFVLLICDYNLHPDQRTLNCHPVT